MYYQIEIRDPDTGKVLRTGPAGKHTTADERKEIAKKLIGDVADAMYKVCEVIWRDGVPESSLTYYSNKSSGNITK